MGEYRFRLQKYRPGCKVTCPNCNKPRCFVRYVDDMGVVSFPDTVGKCDHEVSCGYHYTPREYFQDNPDRFSKEEWMREYRAMPHSIVKPQIETEPSFIPHAVFKASLSHYETNPFYKYLCSVFGTGEAKRLSELYHIGTAAKWGGSTVFWQVDSEGRIRSGKIILYNPETGHRVKDPHPFVSWAHRELHLQDFNLKQCLFGEHLLKKYPEASVMLVESEKTAIIMSHFIPNYVWLATGGINGCFKEEFLCTLKGRDVTLIPDLGAYNSWIEKSKLLSKICSRVEDGTIR